MSTTPELAYLAALESAIERIWEIARRFDLDPYPVHFELVPASIMYEFGSYGLPGRFSHWSRGKAYYRMKTDYDYGLSKIYELVVNTNPSYAFLMEQNDLLQNKVVVAHVLGHCDMFKHNAYFRRTPPNMIDKVSVNADRIRQYEFEHGTQAVEHFLDAVLAIQEHVDPHLFIRQEPEDGSHKAAGPRTSPYDDLWKLEGGPEDAEEQEEERAKRRRFPPEPVKDVLLFLAEHAPRLEGWQRDILLIVREEMQYFVPQMQTKVLNEGWACLVGSTLVQTEEGLLPFAALHERLARGAALRVATGSGARDAVTDRHIRRSAPTIRLRTARGLVLEGAEQHRLSIGPEAWLALADVRVGQRIPLCLGADVWPTALVPLHAAQPLAAPVAVGAGTRSGAAPARPRTTAEYAGRITLGMPTHLTAEVAEFLGYLLAGGTVDAAEQTLTFASGERQVLARYALLLAELFGIQAPDAWEQGGRITVRAPGVVQLLAANGITVGRPRVPEALLRSPRAVVCAFLRGYWECRGALSRAGVRLRAASAEVAETLQVVLLALGVLSQRRGAVLSIRGRAAQRFAQEIGFGLARAAAALGDVVAGQGEQPEADATDVVVSIEHGVADVYDITVARSHRYVANGMLHHNSFWHARIMRELDLSDNEYTEFAQMHAGVLASSRMHINPYHLGYHILEDIERRWDDPTEEERTVLQRVPGQGRAKLFEVRETESDVSLLRTYLTKDLIERLDLYLYRREGDEWVIAEKNWERVRDGIVASMTNFGYPYLTVDNADLHGNTELLLRHHHEGQDLDLTYAEKTLEHVYSIWQRPVHLETKFEGKYLRLSYTGERHVRTPRR